MTKTALLVRNHPDKKAIEADLLQLIEADACHQMALKHALSFRSYKETVPDNGVIPKKFSHHLRSTDKELKAAIRIYEKSISTFMKRLSKRPAEEFLSLNEGQYQELSNIVKKHTKLKQERTKRETTDSGYEQGLLRGKSDGSKRTSPRLSPSLIRCLLSDVYRKEYVRGYRDGFERAKRKSRRQAELRSLQTNDPSLERGH